MKPGDSRRSLLIGLSALSLFLLRPIAAQKSADTPEPTLKIKKTTRLVEVEVIAKDKKGHPVTGLAASDFTLKDNGHIQKVTFFSAQQQPTPELEATEIKNVEKKSVEKKEDVDNNENDDADEEEPAPQPSLVFSNNQSSSAPPVVILMDLINTSWENQTAMKNALIASLKRNTTHAPTALLILAEKLTLVGDFTTDPSSLAALLEKPSTPNQEGIGPAITAPKTPSVKANAAILKAELSAFREESVDRLQRTLSALGLIHNQLSRMRGRKSLIWIGGGLAVGPQDWPTIRRAIEKYNDADIGVYTVDARGVVMDYGVGADVDTQDMLGPWAEEQADTRGDILDVLARSTGGVPYRNTNALDVAISRAVEDLSTIYTLGYYPQHEDWRGAIHKIEVTVARVGVNLRYRSSYIAAPEAPPEPTDQQQMLNAVAASPIDFPGIRFSVELKPGSPSSAPTLTLHVPATELKFSLQDEKSTGSLQYWTIQRQASGSDLTSKAYAFTFHLTPVELESANAQGITLTSKLKLSPGTAKIRVLLRDMNSGRVGTVDVPLSSGVGATTNPAPAR